jgi:hypothetical protein
MTGAEPVLFGLTGGQLAVVGASATAAAISGYSAYQQGQSASAQAKADAAWHAHNAKVAEREAEAERKASEFEVTQQKRRADKLLARQRALRGKSGVDIAGSPLLVMEDTAAQLALENANLREVGHRRVSAYKSQSYLDFTKAQYASKSAKGYRRAGTLSALGTTLGGAARTGYMYGTFKT